MSGLTVTDAVIAVANALDKGEVCAQAQVHDASEVPETNKYTFDELKAIYAEYSKDTDRLWSNTYPSVSHRFPKLSGLALLDFIYKTYSVDMNATFPFYHLGEPNLARDPINDRDEAATRAEYKVRMLKRGFNQAGRSRPVTIPPKAKHPKRAALMQALQQAGRSRSRSRPRARQDKKRNLLAAAHTVEAFYDAKAEQPDNVQLKVSEEQGLQNCIDMHEDTPDDIKRELVFTQNQDNGGSDFNPQQLIHERLRLKEQWKARMEKPGDEVTVKSCGGNAQFEAFHRQWLKDQKNTHFSENWTFYVALGSFLNDITADGTFYEFLHVLKMFYNNAGRKISLESCFRNVHKAHLIVKDAYSTSLPKRRYDILWWESIKSLMPLHGLSDHRMAFDTHEGVTKKLELLATDMRNGKKVQLKLKKAKKSAAEKQKERELAQASRTEERNKKKEAAKAAALAKREATKAHKKRLAEIEKAATGKGSKTKKKKTDAATEDATTSPDTSEPKDAGNENDSTATGDVVALSHESNQDEEPQEEDHQEIQDQAEDEATAIQQNLKDMQFADDANQVIDLASVRLSARGLSLDEVR